MHCTWCPCFTNYALALGYKLFWGDWQHIQYWFTLYFQGRIKFYLQLQFGHGMQTVQSDSKSKIGKWPISSQCRFLLYSNVVQSVIRTDWQWRSNETGSYKSGHFGRIQCTPQFDLAMFTFTCMMGIAKLNPVVVIPESIYETCVRRLRDSLL